MNTYSFINKKEIKMKDGTVLAEGKRFQIRWEETELRHRPRVKASCGGGSQSDHYLYRGKYGFRDQRSYKIGNGRLGGYSDSNGFLWWKHTQCLHPGRSKI